MWTADAPLCRAPEGHESERREPTQVADNPRAKAEEGTLHCGGSVPGHGSEERTHARAVCQV